MRTIQIMVMNNPLIAWGLVFLVGMLATHYMGIEPKVAWVVWLVIFFVGNMLVGKAMKKTPRNIVHMWMVVNILGALMTLAFLAGTLPFNATHIMAVWLVLMGAAVYAGAHENKDPEGVFIGLLWFATGIILPLWLPATPFLIGGLVLGLPYVVGGLLKK